MKKATGKTRPGDAVLISVREADVAPIGSVGPWALAFLPFRGSGYHALMPLSVDVKPGTYQLSLSVGTGRDKTMLAGALDVAPHSFRQDTLTVSKRFTSPSKTERLRAARDAKAFERAFDVGFEKWRFRQNFDWPVPPVVTALFGDRRMFNGKQKGQHFGVDLDGATGSPVRAANSGQVVLVRNCFAEGKSVLVHHGGRLFTAYFHMSKIEVVQGAKVSRGQRLGRVGKTGRVTGPHLHFGVKVDGTWVDPESLLKLDFT